MYTKTKVKNYKDKLSNFQIGIKYLKISILDESDKEIHNYFKEAYDFIHDALSEDSNNNVLIHCAMGKSRSATITIMFLMKRFSWNFEKVFIHSFAFYLLF